MSPTPYTVTESVSPRGVVRQVGPTALAYVGALLWILLSDVGGGTDGDGVFGFTVRVLGVDVGLLFVVVLGMAAFTLYRKTRPDTLLAIGAEGVRVASTRVPWSSIEQIVVVRPEPSAYGPDERAVGVVLSPDAPLPDGLDSLVRDRSNAAAIPPGLRTSVDDESLDTGQLVETVRAYAPAGVSVVERYGTTERVLG